MPDVYAGKGCTIGTTMTITDKAVPNIVGVDIGCVCIRLILANSRLILLGSMRRLTSCLPG
uniref:RtcB family protein n=1 Tax=uncultured Allisonella sp. TaxID=339338 RepID=UPI00349FDB13